MQANGFDGPTKGAGRIVGSEQKGKFVQEGQPKIALRGWCRGFPMVSLGKKEKKRRGKEKEEGKRGRIWAVLAVVHKPRLITSLLSGTICSAER
jgi:hypothetical protein